MRAKAIWLYRYIKPILCRIGAIVLLGCGRTLFSLMFVWQSKTMIDYVSNREGYSLPEFSRQALILVTIVIADILLNVLQFNLRTRTGIQNRNSLQSSLFNHLMHARYSYDSVSHSGDITNRLQEDVKVVSQFIVEDIPQIITTAIQLVAAFTFLSYLDRRLPVAIVILVPLCLILSRVFYKPMKQVTGEIRDTDGKIQSMMQENLQHRTLMMSLERNDIVADNLLGLHNSLASLVGRRCTYTLFSRSMVSVAFRGGYLLAFLWGVWQLNESAITFGVMTAFLQLTSRIQQPIVELAQYLPTIVSASNSVERLRDLSLLDIEEESDSIHLGNQAGVLFDNITFSYLNDSESPTLREFSCNFEMGSKNAILGPTGVGKSTIFRLIEGLVFPTTGSVTLYNSTLKAPASAATRCNIVYIPQGNTLLSGTIRSNLLLGNIKATEEMIAHALHVAVAEFVYNLPQGLDTPCGENGYGFSEGEAQRIAIARGILRPGAILLFDEISSSLDPETEHLMLSRLMDEKSSRTYIFVTHREIVKEFCNKVIYISNSGTYREVSNAL